MSTSGIAVPASPPKGRWVLKSFIAVVLLVVLVFAGICAWVYRAGHASLAQMDGTIAVSGLKSTVTVVRDAQGVPHMTAANLDDLFFAQGYVTAQDRLWQMDMTRRLVGGEAAEILPQSTGNWLQSDKRQRILRMRATAEKIAQRLPERDRMYFEAYARGVNAYVEQNREHLPLEFRVLRYAPKPWTVADSVLVGIGMSQILNPQYEMEYWRGKLAERLSPELKADLYPASSPRDHAPGDDGAQGAGAQARCVGTGCGTSKLPSSQLRTGYALTLVSSLRQKTAQAGVPVPHDSSAQAGAIGPDDPSAQAEATEVHNLRSLMADFSNNRDACEACVPGSNNWVISGAHTVSGKPLLSNDMHLGHRVPGVWYEVQLHSGDFNVVGFSLPGSPYVIVGHNQRIAWGFTNLNPDVQDLFVENFNAKGEYQTPAGWEKPEVDHEVIHVTGKPDVVLDVLVTRHGPVISSFFLGETRKIALQWVVYDTKAIDIPVFDLNAAQNWEQFRAALSRFTTPSQNVVYADVDGHIGYQAMGFVPVRAAGDGTMPVSGADGKHDWTGYLPFAKMPSVYDPPSGIIATANSKITPNGYPYQLATQWYPPYRTERIYQLLSSGKKFSPADMLAVQTDITSNYDRFLATEFAAAIDHNPKASARARHAAEILRGFDGKIVPDSAAPVIVINTRRALWKLLLQAKLDTDWTHYEWSEQAVVLETILREKPQRWLPINYADFNELLTVAVERGLEGAPGDLRSWKYGKEYPLEIIHPLFGAVPGLRRWAGPGIQPQSGGSYTVKQVGRRFGPSERMTVDFSNLDGSTFNIVLGESGQIFSRHFMDQWDAWYNGKTFVMAYSDGAVQAAKSHELRLEPK